MIAANQQLRTVTKDERYSQLCADPALYWRGDMTMPDERTGAVMATREFLKELIDPTLTPGVPEAIRLQAQVLMRHYPSAVDMKLAHLACPRSFGIPGTGRRGK